MPSGAYGQLGLVRDQATRQLLQSMVDQIVELQRQLTVLQGSALQRGSPVHANARIMDLYDPQDAADAVNLQTMQRYVQTQLTGFAARTRPTAAPGIPGETNTIPSDALPLYNGAAIVQGVFAANPGFVATSCQDSPGGTWDLMDAIVDALRAADTRFGYNGKRGNAADPSKDAIAYDYGTVPGGEGSTSVYIVDVISGHCGANPQPGWNDVTVFAPGVWISRGRF